MWKHRAQTERSLCLSVTETHSSVRITSARFRFTTITWLSAHPQASMETLRWKNNGGKLPGLQCAKIEWQKKRKTLGKINCSTDENKNQ